MVTVRVRRRNSLRSELGTWVGEYTDAKGRLRWRVKWDDGRRRTHNRDTLETADGTRVD